MEHIGKSCVYSIKTNFFYENYGINNVSLTEKYELSDYQ